MRTRTFACLVPLALAWGCSQGTLGRGDAAVDGQVLDTAAPDMAIDTGGPQTDGPAVVDAPMPDTAPADAMPEASVDATLDSGAQPPLTGRHSFVVTSTITVHASGGPPPTGVPTAQVFTMVVDADQGTAIVGANGSATLQPVDVSGNSFRVRGSLRIDTGGCYTSVTYDNPAFVVGAGGQLTGSSTGRANWSVTDIGYTAPASMSSTGVNDTQLPVLSVAGTSPDLTDPFTSLSLVASEPLPPDTRAKLIGSASGEVVFLPPPTAQAFTVSLVPSVLLRYDEQYRLSVDGITDFAGNAAAAAATQFTTRTAPPLVAEDGFESAAGATLGGAQIVANTDAPVIAGTRSLYIPASSGGIPGQMPQRTQVALRLTVAAGDTVVRFAYRAVNPNISDGMYFAVASPGGATAAMTVTSSPTPTTPATITGRSVTLGPLTIAEIQLPASASSEVVIARIVRGTGCTGMPGPAIEGMIIDDLRVE
jgi:hypothetical protein